MRKLLASLLIVGLIGVMAVSAMAAASPNPTLKTGTSAKFGAVLTDARGMTVYTYTKDKPNQSNCTGDCLSDWPPVVASGQLRLAPGIPGTIGSITRPGNKVKQVTYNQKPLYYFTDDKKPGDVTGNGEDGFAVVRLTSGTPVASPAASGSGPSRAPAPTATPDSGYNYGY